MEFLKNSNLMPVILALVLTFIVGRIVRLVISKYIESPQETESDNNILRYSFIRDLAVGFVYFLGVGIAIYMVPSLRQLSISMFASSGVIALIAGFASQQALSNVVSGIFIAIFKPFVVGDRIRLADKGIIGVVEDITLRHTVMRTYENKRIVIPNSIISSEVIENSDLADPEVCRFLEFGISYDSDVDLAMKIMREECESHKDILDMRTDEEKENGTPVIQVRVIGYGDSSVNLRAWAWFSDWPVGYKATCDLNYSIKKRFDAEGIEIPFPHRTIMFKNSLDLDNKELKG